MIHRYAPRQLPHETLEKIMQIWLNANQDAHSFVPAAYFLEHYGQVRGLIFGADIYVFEENGEVLGFAGIEGSYLAGLFVKRAARGRGIGKALLQACIAENKKTHLHVYAKNKGAVQFYQNNGFLIIGEKLNEDTKEVEYEMAFHGENK